MQSLDPYAPASRDPGPRWDVDAVRDNMARLVDQGWSLSKTTLQVGLQLPLTPPGLKSPPGGHTAPCRCMLVQPQRVGVVLRLAGQLEDWPRRRHCLEFGPDFATGLRRTAHSPRKATIAAAEVQRIGAEFMPWPRLPTALVQCCGRWPLHTHW